MNLTGPSHGWTLHHNWLVQQQELQVWLSLRNTGRRDAADGTL